MKRIIYSLGILLFIPLSFVLVQCSQDTPLPEGEFVESNVVTYPPGTTVISDQNPYSEYQVGDNTTPIIITAPHGGDITPSNIGDRTAGDAVLTPDANTEDLARKLKEEIFALTGIQPHLIVCKLHRRKMDANRDIGEAAEGNPIAEQVWRDYHGYITSARKAVTDNVGKGLLIDVHGHGHSINRVEVGYLLNRVQLAEPDSEVDRMAPRTSIKAIANDSPLKFSELIRGPKSFGTLLTNNGYQSVPSTQDPQPGINNEFFEGGHTTRTHGSANKGTISAIQLEFGNSGLRDTELNRRALAKKLAIVIKDYLKEHYAIQ